MLDLLLIILILLIVAGLVLLFRVRQELFLLRVLAYQAFSLEEIIRAEKELAESAAAEQKIEEHNSDEYFEKRAKWEFDVAQHQDLLESNLAVLNGKKKIHDAISDHFNNFGVAAEIQYIKNKIKEWKAIKSSGSSETK